MIRLAALVAATVMAACASANGTAEAGAPWEGTLREGDQRWVDGDRLSIFLHSVDPALELATVYLKPADGEQENETMSPDGNRVVDYEDWRITILRIDGPDSATFRIERGGEPR